MTIVTCPECGKEISTDAKTCPHCGRSFGVRWWKVLILTPVVLIGAVFLVGALSDPPTAQSLMRDDIKNCRRGQRSESNPMAAHAIGQKCAILEDVFKSRYGVQP